MSERKMLGQWQSRGAEGYFRTVAGRSTSVCSAWKARSREGWSWFVALTEGGQESGNECPDLATAQREADDAARALGWTLPEDAPAIEMYPRAKSPCRALAPFDGYRYTRPHGHTEGPHVAHGLGGKEVARWGGTTAAPTLPQVIPATVWDCAACGWTGPYHDLMRTAYPGIVACPKCGERDHLGTDGAEPSDIGVEEDATRARVSVTVPAQTPPERARRLEEVLREEAPACVAVGVFLAKPVAPPVTETPAQAFDAWAARCAAEARPLPGRRPWGARWERT